MTAQDALTSLTAAGFRLRVCDGQLLVSPRSRLTDEHARLIAQHKAGLLALLDDPHAGCPDDEALAAIAERAWYDEPAWDKGLCERTSVIYRAEGFEPIVMSEAEEAAWLASNAVARQKAAIPKARRVERGLDFHEEKL